MAFAAQAGCRLAAVAASSQDLCASLSSLSVSGRRLPLPSRIAPTPSRRCLPRAEAAAEAATPEAVPAEAASLPKSNLYAIIDTGGHQLWVEPGRFYHATFLPDAEPNTKILLNRVLAVRTPEGLSVGQPWVQNAQVKGRVLHVFKDKKVTIFKFQRKKHYKRKTGHRQRFTRFVVDSIQVDGKEMTATA